MTYEELQNEVLRLHNQIKEWVSFVEELKDENTELKAKLQELQNAEKGYAIIFKEGGGIHELSNHLGIEQLQIFSIEEDANLMLASDYEDKFIVKPCRVVIEK